MLASDLNTDQRLAVRASFDYETGPYEGVDKLTPAKPFLVKTDYNLNNSNKISFRYSQLNSSTDALLSTSSSLGFGRSSGTNTTFLGFKNSNYSILENYRSGIGEWNSTIGNTMSNSLTVGYTTNDESRGDAGTLFPFIDILDGAGVAYTSFGSEPFTPNNELRYNTFQLQDSFTKVHEPTHAHLRRERRALSLGERVLPRQAERLRLQHARRFLHRPERLPRQPESHDLAGVAAALPGALQQHPGTGEADPAALGVVLGRLRAGRVAAEARTSRSRRASAWTSRSSATPPTATPTSTR